MAARTAWVLNLDADLELAAGPRYSPTKTVRAAMAPYVAKLAASLLGPEDVLVDDDEATGARAAGLIGRAFCPTSRAIEVLLRAGARPAPHPTHAVLREVNGRAFSAGLGPGLPGGVFVRDLDAALVALSDAPEGASAWRVKRAFSMAGRGQRRITPGTVNHGDVSFLRSAIGSEGGVMIEPDVAIVRELGIHGMIEQSGAFRLGRLVEQQCDAHGQWLATSWADRADASIARALDREGVAVARALHAAGYFGPFGIDAFVYRDRAGALRLQPRSEINARYSMGFTVGFGVGS